MEATDNKQQRQCASGIGKEAATDQWVYAGVYPKSVIRWHLCFGPGRPYVLFIQNAAGVWMGDGERSRPYPHRRQGSDKILESGES